jgi:hypothetical protein
LNALQTRVQILTGKYAGIVFEYGGSVLAQDENQNTFTFEYTLYEVPDQFYGPRLRTDGEFNQFLGYLIVDVIGSRNQDPEEVNKSMEAASANGIQKSIIKIDPKFYSKAVVI